MIIMVKERTADASLYTKYKRQSVSAKLTLSDDDTRAPPASRVSVVSQSPYGVNIPISFQFRFGGQSADRFVTLSDVLLSIVSGTTRNLILNFNLSRPLQLPVGVELYRNTSASTTGGTLIASSTVPPTFTSSNVYPYYHYYSKATLNSAEYTSNVVNTNSTLIETIVGTYGAGGVGGDDGPASQAQLNNPRGISYSPVRDILVIGDGSSKVRAVNLGTTSINIYGQTIGAGNIKTVLSGDSATPAVDVDIDETIYVYETDSPRISKVTKESSTRTVIAGNGTNSFSGDGGLATNAVIGGSQSILIAKNRRFLCFAQVNPAGSACRIRCINIGSSNLIISGRTIAPNNIHTIAGIGGDFTSTGDGGDAKVANFANVRGICLSPDENILYLADNGNSIRAVNLITTPITVFGTTIAGGNIETIVNGSTTSPKPIIPSGQGFDAVRGLNMDRLGNMYIANQSGRVIQRLDAVTNEIRIIAGSYGVAVSGAQPNGQPAINGRWEAVRGITFDSKNNIYAVDSGAGVANIVRRIY